MKEGAGDARRDDRLLHDLTRHTDNDARPVRLLGAGPYLNLAHRRRRDDVARGKITLKYFDSGYSTRARAGELELAVATATRRANRVIIVMDEACKLL